ncbi:hypothetical protein TNCT_11521 [Trichonephila clavata]|uniref:Uncharacterized protein n=1 Tax=Trichonephila clavata TaxID=2740835 RepID=A0A8X6GTW7_TRICU|nr:hypothetical protein TNCT_11521 [Trichonephila clavata]
MLRGTLEPTHPYSNDIHMEPFSMLQSSKCSLKYILLPPRSAPADTPVWFTSWSSILSTINLLLVSLHSDAKYFREKRPGIEGEFLPTP